MKIVQTVEEVPYVSSEYREHAIVTVLTDESYEVHAHLIEEFFFRHAEYLKCIHSNFAASALVFLCEKLNIINQLYIILGNF